MTKQQIAIKARNLGDALSGEPTLVGRTLRELAYMIADLANAEEMATATTVPLRGRTKRRK